MANTTVVHTGSLSLYQFIVGLLFVGGLTWYANINDDTGNTAALVVGLMWLLWAIFNSSVISGVAGKL